MADIAVVAGSIVGGSLGGAVVGAWQAARLRKTTRRGRARLVHEDLYRLQSTLTRLRYQSEEGSWGEAAWLLHPLADKGDQQDVLAHLRGRKGWRFGVCAGALGWAEYLRGTYEPGKEGAPSDEQIRQMYERLAWGRAALESLARLRYKEHDPALVVPANERRRDSADDRGLPKIDRAQALRDAKAYRSERENPLGSLVGATRRGGT